MGRPKLTDKQIRDALLVWWKKMDLAIPGPRCRGDGTLLMPYATTYPSSAEVPKCSGCEACTGRRVARAVELHCGGRGLAVGCPVCGRRWPS